MANGDPFRKVQPGQPLQISANWFNTVTEDLLSRHRQRMSGGAGAAQADPARNTGVVKVKNASGSDVARFGVLGINTILFGPADNLIEFQNNAALSCITPTAAHAGKFVVLLEPAADGAIALAVVSGIVPVQINVTDAAHGWADVKAADLTQLNSGASGTAQIVYKEVGTGMKWAMVRLGAGASSGTRVVNLTQRGGANGNKTSAATYTYDLYERLADGTNGVKLNAGSPLAPLKPRPNGTAVAATAGMAYMDPAEEWKLAEAYEKYGTGACP